jgi:hypothetical protein
MGAFPLVDLYELAPFRVIASADETAEGAYARFYLYHTTDRRARARNPDGSAGAVATLDESAATRIPFEAALRAHGVRCDDDRHLGDAVVEFWKAFFAPPSDPFDETDFANSPWLDRSVGDRRSIGELKRGGEWDDLWLYFRPRKTVGWGTAAPALVRPLPEKAAGLLDDARGRLREGLVMEAVPLVIDAMELSRRSEAGLVSLVVPPPTVEVAQLGPRVVGLTRLDDGPAEVPMMVLLRA